MKTDPPKKYNNTKTAKKNPNMKKDKKRNEKDEKLQ